MEKWYISGHAHSPSYSRAGFTLREAPGTLGIFATSFCQIQVKTKKKSYNLRAGPWHCVIW